LPGPVGVEERVDEAVVERAFLHFAFGDASAADGPEAVDDGGEALELEFSGRREFEGQSRLHLFEFSGILGGDPQLAVGGGCGDGGRRIFG
jgi:hypothetical protein